jgi:primase-polymerase (primpol)-like protein
MESTLHPSGHKDHTIEIKENLSWALFSRIEMDKKGEPVKKIPVTLYYDPLTQSRIKVSKLPEDWQCSYEDALKVLSVSGGYYDGIAFLLTEKDPYHLTIVKSGAWGLEHKSYKDEDWERYHEEVRYTVGKILKEQNTYAFSAPFGSDIYLIGKAMRPEGRYKICKWERYESYDGGWDDKQKKFTPKFVPFSEVTVSDYDIPINDVQWWVDEFLPERDKLLPETIGREGTEDSSDCWDLDMWKKWASESRRSGPQKTALIKSVSTPPKNTDPVISNIRCATWRYENPQAVEVEDHLGRMSKKWKYDRPARSPKTGQKILWAEKFEENKHLWGSYEEAYEDHEDDEESQGVILLIEPYRSFRIDGKAYYVVFFDFDDCRDPDTEEILPRVKEWMEAMDTYFEVSPSGKGVRGIGLAEKKPGSRSRFEIDGQKVEVYGGNQGGRHLITFTGVPIEGFDRPINNVQEWVDENVEVEEECASDTLIPPEPLGLEEEEIKQVILSSKDGSLMERFWEGDDSLWTGSDARYESSSEADLGFFRKLAFYTQGDEERMMRIAFSSRMHRKKWEQGNYLKETIRKAIKSCRGEFYTPGFSSHSEMIEELLGVWMTIRDHTLRRAFGSLLSIANAYGYYTREGFVIKAHGKEYVMPEEGLWVYASIRDIGIWMGEQNTSNISRAMKRLKDEGYVLRISKGKGGKGSLYLIPKSLIPEKAPEEGGLRDPKTLLLSSCVSLLCCKNEGSLYKKLVWTQNGKKGLTVTQKYVFGTVLFFDITDLDDLSSITGIRKDNLMSRVTNHMRYLNLIEYEGNELKLSDNYEEALHQVFVGSGGEKALLKALEKFKGEREEHSLHGEEANWKRSEEKIEAYLNGDLNKDDLTPWEKNQANARCWASMISKARASSSAGIPVTSSTEADREEVRTHG